MKAAMSNESTGLFSGPQSSLNLLVFRSDVGNGVGAETINTLVERREAHDMTALGGHQNITPETSHHMLQRAR